MEHEAQPYQGDQHQLVEKEMGYHGKTPSYKCSNEDILPGFQTVGISRRLEVHDQISMHGYEVIRFKAENQGYLEDVKRLVEMIEHDMEKAGSEYWNVAIELEVKNTESIIPF